MQTRVYLRAFENDDYKTTIARCNNLLIINQLAGNYLFLRHERRNG